MIICFCCNAIRISRSVSIIDPSTISLRPLLDSF